MVFAFSKLTRVVSNWPLRNASLAYNKLFLRLRAIALNASHEEGDREHFNLLRLFASVVDEYLTTNSTRQKVN